MIKMAKLSVVIVSFYCLAAVSSVQQYPQFKSYDYISDYVDPARNGESHYHQPRAFAAPIPILAVPVYTKVEIPVVEPAIVEEVHGADEDDEDDDSRDYKKDGGDDYDSYDDNDSAQGEDEDESHEDSDGEANGAAHHSDQSESGLLGSNSLHGSRKRESVGHGADKHEGFYHKAAEKQGKHNVEADAYSENNEASRGYKAEDFGNKKGHSKGEETTGFHKVYRKDDFKKDHVFYDKADDNGHFNKHASEDSHHNSAAAGHKKGGHYDSANKEGGFGKVDRSKNGKNHNADNGYAGEGGDESHHSHRGDYAEKGGRANGKEFGYDH